MADTKKESGSVFEELRDDLFREAAELASEAPSTNIAIVITPPPGFESDVSTCSFVHPSAEGKGNGKGKAPEEGDEEEKEKDLSSPKGWWNNGKQLESMTAEELKEAHDQLLNLKNLITTAEMEATSGNPKP